MVICSIYARNIFNESQTGYPGRSQINDPIASDHNVDVREVRNLCERRKRRSGSVADRPVVKVNVIVASVVAEPRSEERISLKNEHTFVFYLFKLMADFLKMSFSHLTQ